MFHSYTQTYSQRNRKNIGIKGAAIPIFHNKQDSFYNMTLCFRLSDEFIDTYQGRQPPFGFGEVGALTYIRTYARRKPDGSLENWIDTVRRVVEGTYSIQKEHIISNNLGWSDEHGKRSAEEMFDRMFHMKFLPPGRGLSVMGTDVVHKRKLAAALNNCAFVSTENIYDDHHLSNPFTFLMDASMLGVGVGFDCKGAKLDINDPKAIFVQRYEHPPIPFNLLKKEDLEMNDNGQTVFHIVDSREGWVDSIRVLLETLLSRRPTHADPLKPFPILFDYSAIREAGAPLKTFGGVASGDGPLRELHTSICSVLCDRQATKEDTILTSRIIVDIMNLIGRCVVSGNIRRTAEIAFGEPDDMSFLDLKNYQKYPERMAWGWLSNNSIFAKVGMDYSDIAERICDNGEPGLAWLDNMRDYSRMGDSPDYKDFRVAGGNPCITSDTLILTKIGWRAVHELVDQPFVAIVQGTQVPCDNGFFKTGTKEVFELETQDGYSIKATSDHLLRTVEGEWKSLDEIRNEKRDVKLLLGHTWHSIEKDMSDMDGLLRLDSDSTFLMNNAFRFQKRWCYFLRSSKENDSWYNYTMSSMRYLWRSSFRAIRAVQESPAYDPDRQPLIYPELIGAIFGKLLADFDILVMGNQTVPRFGTYWYNFRYLQKLQLMLQAIGIGSKIYQEEAECYRLTISCAYDCHRVMKFMTIMHKRYFAEIPETWLKAILHYKSNQEVISIENWEKEKKVMTKVTRIRSLGKKDVYDCTMTGAKNFPMGDDGPLIEHAFVANGLVVHNCLEQSLESYELCCLVETFPAHHHSLDDYLRTLKFAYLYAKTVTLCQTHWSDTNRVMLRNRRIGCSLSGIAQFLSKRSLEEFREWCDRGYYEVQLWDEIYSDWLCVPRSIKTTSIKPSGTVSLLAGATPGCHFPESRFYIRRIRVSNTSPICKVMKEAGYTVEPCFGSEGTTNVIEIPCDSGEGVRTVREVSMWEKLFLAAFLQEHWADNQVSCTIAFDKEKEGHMIADALNYFQYKLKGISFLPILDGGTVYPQMPYESIDEQTFIEMQQGLKKVSWEEARAPVESTGGQQECEAAIPASSAFCDSDKCVL